MSESCNCSTYEDKFSNEKVDLTQIDSAIEKYKGKKGSLISLLQDVQEIYGFLPLSAMEYIADNTEHMKSVICGVATFYTQFRLKPVGKNLILQCQGTACHVNGSKEISKAICQELDINPGETSADGLFSIEDVACLGCCSLAPVIMVNDDAYGNLTPKTAVEVIREIKKLEVANGN